MLQSLHIKNFAIVTQLELQIPQGLTIISGETGAGKSILIDALGLVLGERADSQAVRQGCSYAQVSASFSISSVVLEWLQQHHLAQEEECLVRRIIYANGRSRGYINDQPVTLQILKQLGEQLIDIHGQHGHQSLLSTEVQRQLLDDIADDNTLIIQLRQAYQQWKAVQTLLTQLGGRDYEAKLALLRYQVQELSAFELTPQALEDLETEHQRLAHASELLTHSQQALSGLAAEEGPSSIAYLTQVQHALHHVQQHDPRLDSVVHLLEHALIHIQEATRELQHYVAHLELDPERLQGVEQQIAALQDLTRKHKIRFAELPQYFQDLTQQLQQLEADQARLAHLDTEMAAALHHYRQAAATVHQQRLQTAQQLSEKITMHMQQLGMTGGQFTIRVTADEHATPTLQGNDKVEFLVTTNPGIAPRALSKVASGGELSRISLAIQVMIAQKSGVPSLVFDEVDVGIGGGIAEIVGKLLNQLGQQRQILCITHLPQVACQGHHHWQVSKTIQAQHTHTCIKQLTLEERIEEIARMLGGLEITAHTLVHAQEMLQRAHQLTSTMNS